MAIRDLFQFKKGKTTFVFMEGKEEWVKLPYPHQLLYG